MTSTLDPPRAEADEPSEAAEPSEPHDGRARLIRYATGGLAAVLLIAAVVLVTHHHGPTRTPQRFCADLAAARGATAALALGNAAQIEAAVTKLDRAARSAPKAIEPQVTTLVTYADGLAAAVQKGTDPSAAMAAAARRQAGQIAKVDAAGRALQQYARQTCGFALSAG
jgi:hypothetical protein